MITVLMHLFPRSWRDRYEEEYRALLEDTGLSPSTAGNVLAHAGSVRARQHRVGLSQVAALLMFAAAEVLAISAGFTVNMFWLPRTPASLLLLAAVVGSLLVIVRPVLVRARRLAARLVHR